MAHPFFDEATYRYDLKEGSALYDTLAHTITDGEAIEILYAKCGSNLRPLFVKQSSILVWREALDNLALAGRLKRLCEILLDDGQYGGLRKVVEDVLNAPPVDAVVRPLVDEQELAPRANDFLPEGHLRILVGRYKLVYWISGDERLAVRRRQIFANVDTFYVASKRISKSAERRDRLVRDMVVESLIEDGTFRDYLERQDAAELWEEKAWDNARRAMAGLIMNLHAQACASGEWVAATAGEKAA
jgi:hypothetical protein